jgi:hypothetical protein
MMAIHKILLASAVLLAMPFMALTKAATNDQEKGQVLAALQSVADEWNKTQVISTYHFESALTIVDNTPPYLFQGPDAVKNWFKAYRDSQPQAATSAKMSLRFLEPQTVEIEGDHAYIAAPAEWTVALDGRSDISHGVVTATLNRASQGWRIAAWIWTPR